MKNNNSELEAAKFKAIKYIGISKKTEFEVIRKLKTSNFSDDIISNTIYYLNELEYINDKEYVDAYIRQCVRLQNFSIYEIYNKLLQKGINKDILENKLDNLRQTDYEDKLIEKLVNTKCKDYDDLKLKQYLYRRGLKFRD